MLTIKQLMRYVTTDRRKRANQVRISGFARKVTKSGNPVYVAKTSIRTDAQGNRKPTIETHVTRVELLKNEGATKQKPYVRVYCDCGFHAFNCEYALTKQGASKIVYSNGEAPKVRNTELKPLTCIHTIALMEKIGG